MNELEHIKMCMDLGFNLGRGLKMKTLQENIDTIEDCRSKKYENSLEYEPEEGGENENN